MLRNKILNRATLKSVVNRLKKRNKRIVFTNGCFDILHFGHIQYLKKAKTWGDILFVGVNSDASVRKIKGKGRPINNQKARLGVLAGLEPVDFLILFNETTPLNLIKAVRPDILVKGADWKAEDIVGAKLVLKNGGKVIRIPYVKGYSTTAIIKKIR